MIFPAKAPSLTVAFLFALALPGAAAERAVVIVAGQSNLLNWHAAAAQLPTDSRDRSVLFYYETGAPPNRGGLTPFNATSGGTWTTLQPQRQEPFVKYERDFFGPEISLARSLVGAGVPSLAVIKVGYFGTNLALDWNPGAQSGNQLYAKLRQHVATALQALRAQGDQPRLGGFFWMQGETDAAKADHAAAYGDNLTRFIARVRTDFAEPGLPFVLGRIGPTPPRGYPYQDIVRKAQVGATTGGTALAWVDTDDLRRDTDSVHLLAPGVITLGERMANAWLKLRPLPPLP